MGDIPPEFAERFTFTVVGVVGSVRHNTLETLARPAAYFPFRQATTGHSGNWGMSILVRTHGDPLALVPAIRGEVARFDRSLPIFGVTTMTSGVAASLAGRRFPMTLLSLFATLALLLAAVGVYGVLGHAVSQRRREIGVRLALGAGRRDLLRQIVGEGMASVAVGLVAGTLIASIGSSFRSRFLFGIDPVDPVTFASGVLILAVAGLLACGFPAWRAARLAPVEALRDS